MSETKWTSLNSDQQIIGSGSGGLVSLALIPAITQGTGKSNRIGTKIQGKRLTVRLFCGYASTAASGLFGVRIALVTWRGGNIPGVVTTSDIFENSSTINEHSVAPWATQNLNVIKSWRLQIAPPTESATLVYRDGRTVYKAFTKDISIPWKRNFNWNTFGGQINDEINPYLLVWTSHTSVGLSDALRFLMSSRFSFKDI